MSMGGKTYKYVPDYTSANLMAQRATDLWDRYNEAYAPKTRELISELGNIPGRTERAAGISGEYADRANADMLRTISQYGIQLSPLQRESLARKMESSKALGVIAGKTTQDDVNREQTEWLRQNLIQAGVGVRGASNAALEAAVNLENQRNQEGYQKASQKTAKSQARVAGWQNLIGTGASIATAAALS